MQRYQQLLEMEKMKMKMKVGEFKTFPVREGVFALCPLRLSWTRHVRSRDDNGNGKLYWLQMCL